MINECACFGLSGFDRGRGGRGRERDSAAPVTPPLKRCATSHGGGGGGLGGRQFERGSGGSAAAIAAMRLLDDSDGSGDAM